MFDDLAHQGLIRLKSIIFIGKKLGEPLGELGIMLVFMPTYRFGSHHLYDLSAAMDTFQRLGDPTVREACNDLNGIMVLPRESESPLPANTRKRSCSNCPFESLPYVPKMIEVSRVHACDDRRTAAFFEAVLWLSAKPPVLGHSQLQVQVRKENADFFENCARKVSGPEGKFAQAIL